ncbi:unnamed protein product [Ostreobium quekettii]|uniref:Cytochrome P450 n=1 Tax=Ostreobium quekettii TaxID=121088 RepID=A0A8S1IXC0_9CHLO|nr:unnamed protein product [Ostreobium quekettii]
MGIVNQRRKEPTIADKAKKDFITLMIEARERESGRALNDLEILHNSRLFLAAGHETTAGTLAIFLFHVAQHPEVEKKILEEVDRLNDRKPPSYEGLERYQYLEWALNESMRMLSVVPLLSRKASQDFHLGGTVRVPKGAGIVIPIHWLHHDAKLWGDPENFRPERFDTGSDECQKRHPQAFMPFGGGPRVCLGSKFAIMEMLLVLIMLYRQYTFSVDGSCTSTPLKINVSVTIEPTDGIHLHVHERQNGFGMKAP